MSEQFRSSSVSALPPIGAADPTHSLAPGHGEAVGAAPATGAARADRSNAPAQPSEPKAASGGRSPHNIRLHFKIDPQTDDVTVFMVDTSARRVIRTIPPEELQKLNEGDLVELLA